MELYDYFRSSASYRVRIALNYKNIQYSVNEVHLVNNGGEQHSAEYRKINCQELVPSLKVGDDENNVILTQSLAIIEYLEERYPEPRLLPQNLILRAKARAMACIIACDVHPLNNLRVLEYLKENFNVDNPKKTAWYHNWLIKGFDSYEYYAKQLEEFGEFSTGESFSLADLFLIPQVYNAIRFELSMSNYPRIMSIYNHCLQLPFVDSAKP